VVDKIVIEIAGAVVRAEPGKVNFASAGIGTTQHVSGELFKIMTGVNIVHVPYRGTMDVLSYELGAGPGSHFDREGPGPSSLNQGIVATYRAAITCSTGALHRGRIDRAICQGRPASYRCGALRAPRPLVSSGGLASRRRVRSGRRDYPGRDRCPREQAERERPDSQLRPTAESGLVIVGCGRSFDHGAH